MLFINMQNLWKKEDGFKWVRNKSEFNEDLKTNSMKIVI